MNYFFDTHVIVRLPTEPIHLLSVAVVSEDGRELYLQNSRAPLAKMSSYQHQYVHPRLEHIDCWARIARITEHECPWVPPEDIGPKIIHFILTSGEDQTLWLSLSRGGYTDVVLRSVMGDGLLPMFSDLRTHTGTEFTPLVPWPDFELIHSHALEYARYMRDTWKSIPQ